MTEPELEGRGLSFASRRKFMWLGGGIVASLLLLPEFSLAAKVSKAVKGAATGKSGKAAKATSSSKASASAKRTKSAKSSAASRSVGKGKASAQAAAKGSKGSRVASSKGKSSTKSRVASSRTKHGKVARGKASSKSKSVATARAEVVETPEFELPSSFSPSRGFAFGDGSAESRALSLFCVHTGERLKVDYYVDGRYEPDAMAAIDHLLRDYHNDETCQFDPRVLNQLYDIRRALGSSEPFHVFSGYRSPTTNESYRRLGGRVAEHSYHLTGQAIDVQLPGRDIRQLRNVAVAMRAGGVGYYPRDGFLHVDSGPVRRWS